MQPPARLGLLGMCMHLLVLGIARHAHVPPRTRIALALGEQMPGLACCAWFSHTDVAGDTPFAEKS